MGFRTNLSLSLATVILFLFLLSPFVDFLLLLAGFLAGADFLPKEVCLGGSFFSATFASAVLLKKGSYVSNWKIDVFLSNIIGEILFNDLTISNPFYV